MDPELLTAGEFTRAIQTIHTRFNDLDGRLDLCTSDIASVKATLDERAPQEKRQTRNTASGWSAAVAGGIVIAAKALEMAWGAK